MSFSFSAIRVEKSDNAGLLRFSTGKLYHIIGDPESCVRNYLHSIRKNLGHENANMFPLDYYMEGINNTRHFTFQQDYKGIPVFGRYIRVHISGDVVTSLSSNIDNIELSIVPIITKSSALDIVQLDYLSIPYYLQYKT